MIIKIGLSSVSLETRHDGDHLTCELDAHCVRVLTDNIWCWSDSAIQPYRETVAK